MSQQNISEDNQPQFAAQRLYVKDVSLESPKAPAIFKKQANWRPEVKLDINSKNSILDEKEGLHEVVLSLTASATQEDATLFVVEVQQAGVFMIKNLEIEELHRTLGSFCLNFLFPYARQTIDDLVSKASFPPLMLAPVNFDALYVQAQEQKKAQKRNSSSPTSTMTV